MGFLEELDQKYPQETPKEEPTKPSGFLGELESKYKDAPVEQPKSFLSDLEQKYDVNPDSLRSRKERGEPLSEDQERVIFDADRARSLGEQAAATGKGVFTSLSEMVPQAFEGSKRIIGANKDLLKEIGIKYLDVNPLVPEIAVNYIAGNTAEDRKDALEKAAKKESETVRSLASGAVQAGEEVINEAARGAFFGTPLTDLVQEYPTGKLAVEAMKAGGPVGFASELLSQKIFGEPLVDLKPITKDESFLRSRQRESMRQQEQQEYKDLPERTTAALVKLAESSVGSALGKSLGVPSDEQFQKDLVQELKNNAIVPDKDIAMIGNMLSPLDPTFILAGPLARASSKAFDIASGAGLRAITKPTIAGMNPLEATGRVIRFGGEGAQNVARKFSDFLTGSEDSFIGKLADPLVAVTKRPGMMVEGAGRALRDIGRQIDDVGVRSRTGIIERAGQDARSGDFMRTVFGSGTEKAQARALKAAEKLAGEGGEAGVPTSTLSSKRLAAARTADWVFRQAEAIARYGTSGAAIGTALGLPDIENAEQLGQVATTGAMVGAIGGMRLGEKGAKIIDPRVSLKGKIDAILADDPVSRRADEDADIERFRNTASPDIINKADELGNINSVLQSFDGHIQNLTAQRDQAIARGEGDVAAGIELEIQKTIASKDAVSKMTPDAAKEYQRRVDLTLSDALDQAKTTGEAVGLNNIEIKLLSPVEMLGHLRDKWGSTLTNAEYVLQSLAGNNDLSDADQQKLNQAQETVNQFNAMYQTAMGQRGYAMSENTYSDSPMHLRPANLKTPSVVINSELVKSQLGNNLYGTLRHEIDHALRNFKEVRAMMGPLEEYLFGKKVQNADGSITEISKGIYDDAAIDRMGDYYADLLGGDKWKAGFATEGQYRDYIKEEILAEAAGLSSNTANLRADLDSPGQAFVDWAATANKNTLIGRIRDALGLKGVLLDESGGISDILGETLSPEVLALTRQYQRQLRDYNGSLSQITSASGPEVTISAPELLSSKILQNKYRGLDIWQKEQVLTIKDDEGNVVREVVVPQSASLNTLVGQYRLEGGMLVDENGNKMQIAPEIAAANLPDNTNLSVDQRIARNPDGSPKILSNREIQARARKRGQVLRNAIEGAVEDGSTNRVRPVGEDEYAGILSPSQMQAILELPNDIVSPELKRKIVAFNEVCLRKDGTRMIVEYQAALKGGKYKALAPKIRDVVPFGFRITKDGNFLATTISVSRIFDKINAWAKPNRNRLNLWNGDTNALWEDIIHVLKNHQKGERGEVGLDVDPDMAKLKKDRINDIFNLFDKATEANNPDRSVSKTRKGQDSIDRVIMGMRMDRVNDFAVSNAQKLPVDYGKIKENYMPYVPVDPVEEAGFNWPPEVEDAIVRVRSVLENPENMPTEAKPEAPLPVNLYESGTSLESFGSDSLKEIAKYYGVPVPEKAGRGEIIDLVQNQKSGVQFKPVVPEDGKESKFAFTTSTTRNDEIKRLIANGDEDGIRNLNRTTILHVLSDLKNVNVSIEDAKGVYQGDKEISSIVKVRTKNDEDLNKVRSRLADAAKLFQQMEFLEEKLNGGDRELLGQVDDEGYKHIGSATLFTDGVTEQQIETARKLAGIDGLTLADGRVELYDRGDDPEFFNRVAAFDRAIRQAGGMVASSETGVAAVKSYSEDPQQYQGTIGYDDESLSIHSAKGERDRLSTPLVTKLLGLLGRPLDALENGKRSYFEAVDLTPRQVKKQVDIADRFNDLPVNDLDNPLVQKAYQRLSEEILKQYDSLVAGPDGTRFTSQLWSEGGEPYKSSAEAVKDIQTNNSLKFLKTDPTVFGPEGVDFSFHPLLEDSGRRDANGVPLVYNDLFRAVHDAIAHGLFGAEFGPIGEESAWQTHLRTIDDPWARWALTSETRGQNSYVNYRREMLNENGMPIKKGEEGYIPLEKRGFADQKAALLPLTDSMTGNAKVDEPVKKLMEELGPEESMGSYAGPAFKPANITRKVGANEDFITIPEENAARSALNSSKQPKFGAARELKAGYPVALRIDIPAFKSTGNYVVTVHEKGTPSKVGEVIGYDTIARIDNPQFMSNETGAEKIKKGESNKFPIATVAGEFNPSREMPADINDWTPVGFDPSEHSYFYDKATDELVLGGDEAVSVGNTVFVKNPVYGDKATARFMPAARKGDSPASTLSKDERDAAVKFLERGTLTAANVLDSLAKLSNGDMQSITEKLSTGRLFELAHRATGTPILNRVDAISAIRREINNRKEAMPQSNIAAPMADDIVRTPVNRQAAQGVSYQPATNVSTTEIAPDPKDKAATAAWSKFDEESRKRVEEQVGKNATAQSIRKAIAQERDRIRRYSSTPDAAGMKTLMADATAEGEVAGEEFKSEPLLVRSDYVTRADGSKKYKDVVEKSLTDQPLVVPPMPNTLITKENNPLALKSKNVAGLKAGRYQKEIGDRIDAGAARIADDPEILTNTTGYAEYMRDMGVTGDILTPPSALKMMLTNPDQTLALLKGGYHGNKTVAGTKEAAIQGLDGVAEMRRILNGQGPTPLVTALHHFWGTLSKQLPPIQQEALWMRLISNPLVMEQIQNSIDGKYTLTLAQWKAVVQKAKTQNQGNYGKFGNNATANANSFHLMLANHNGKWDQVANVYKNDDSVAMRNEFWGLGHGPTGIKNKVQSFIGLTFGIPSNILDRWRFVSLNLPMLMNMKKSPAAPEFFEYSGRNKTVPTDPIGVYKNYGTVENDNVPLSIALYSGLDRAVQAGIDNSPALKEYLGAHANPGGFHWIDWNAIKNEAVGHSSLDITKSFLTQYGRDATASDFLDHVKKTSIYTEGENKGKIIRLKMDGGVFSMEEQ